MQQNRIATCFHVIQGATRVTVKLVETGQKFHIEGITASDEKHDLAILKVTDFGAVPLSLGDSDAIQIGEAIHVAGNPQLPLEGKLTLFEGTIIPGIISSTREGASDEFLEYLRDNIGIFPGKVLQMSARIYPGCSGGPVLNEKGKVIGISFMTFKGAEFFNFAMPANYLKALLAQEGLAIPLAQKAKSIPALTYFLWGNMEFEQEQYAEAIADFNETIRLKPNFADAYYNRGIAKYKLGQHESALIDFDETIRLKPNFADAYHNRGVARVSLGFYDSGIADFDKVVQINQVMDTPYKSALADYDQAIRLELDFVEAYRNRESKLLSLGNDVWGFNDFRRSYFVLGADERLTSKANHNWDLPLEIPIREAYLNRGIAKQLLGQHEAAIVDFEKATQLNAEAVFKLQVQIAVQQSVLQSRVQREREAELATAYKANDLPNVNNVNNAFILLYQGLSKIMLDRPDEAKVDFQTALELAVKFRSKYLEVILNQLLATNNNDALKITAKQLLQDLNQ